MYMDLKYISVIVNSWRKNINNQDHLSDSRKHIATARRLIQLRTTLSHFWTSAILIAFLVDSSTKVAIDLQRIRVSKTQRNMQGECSTVLSP